MDAGPWSFIGISALSLWLLQTIIALKTSRGTILGAVADNSAVSALGYDYLLSLISILAWAVSLENGVA